MARVDNNFLKGGIVRKFLDGLYLISGVAAACFLAAIAVIVLAQVGLNVVDKIAEILTGEAVGLVIPSYADFTGFFLAATSFLALAYTLRQGAHIRVNLLIQRFGPQARRWIEVWCTAIAALFSGYFTWFMLRLTFESYEFNDLSTGIVPVPIWIPQVALVVGLAVLSIALIDTCWGALRGHLPSYVASENEPQANDEI